MLVKSQPLHSLFDYAFLNNQLKISKMNQTKLFLITCLLLGGTFLKAQTADEIIQNYLETIGGKEKLMALKGIKMQAKVNQGGLEIPLEIVQMTGGKQYTKITFQGTEFKQGVFDGNTLWNVNFQSMQAEKSDAEETANYKLDINDFPDPFLNYNEKGYSLELVGKETIDGAETFKIKLIKEPKMVDGNQVEDVLYYYFDSEAFVPLAVDSEIKSGQMAGAIQRITFSDYQEVSGLIFPYSMTQGVKDGPSQPIMISTIEVNPTTSDADFAYPGN